MFNFKSLSTKSKKITVLRSGNTKYNSLDKTLHIYNGTVTSPVINYEIVDGIQISITTSGNVYVTAPHTIYQDIDKVTTVQYNR